MRGIVLSVEIEVAEVTVPPVYHQSTASGVLRRISVDVVEAVSETF